MKTIQSILFLSLAIAMAGMYTSCKKENLPNNGEPLIRYVRITSPESSDSLLVGAYQSNLIAIIGENLEDAQEIWFNDQKASLTPTYITSTTILVSVPAEIPKEISNILKIIKKIIYKFIIYQLSIREFQLPMKWNQQFPGYFIK